VSEYSQVLAVGLEVYEGKAYSTTRKTVLSITIFFLTNIFKIRLKNINGRLLFHEIQDGWKN